ncbi:hypothetical protein Tco_0993622 [Tanacetum coccineum]
MVSELNSLWREFDIMTKLPICTCAAREDVSKHNPLIKLMQFLMGLNDVFQPIRSSLLSRETLPNIKDVFAIVSREESHKGIASSFSGSVPNPQVSSFVAKSNHCENGTTLSFTNEQIMKLMSLINDVPFGSVQANMAGRGTFFNSNVFFNINFKVFFNSNSVVCKITMGWIIDSGANHC